MPCRCRSCAPCARLMVSSPKATQLTKSSEVSRRVLSYIYICIYDSICVLSRPLAAFSDRLQKNKNVSRPLAQAPLLLHASVFQTYQPVENAGENLLWRRALIARVSNCARELHRLRYIRLDRDIQIRECDGFTGVMTPTLLISPLPSPAS